MNLATRLGLSLLGVGAFVGAWHFGALSNARTYRLSAFGFAPAREGSARVVVLETDGSLAESEEVSLSLSDRAAAVERIRILWGAHQPKLAAIPPNSAPLRAVLEAAKKEFGGGLIIEELSAGSAEARARELQTRRRTVARDIPTPLESVLALVEMIETGTMFRYAVASLFRVGAGFFLAVLLGIPFGLALGSFAWVSALTNSLIQILRPISPIAWLPVATIVFGGGDKAAVYLIFLCSFFPIAISTAAAIATVDLKYRRSAMNFGITGLASARYVLLPAALPAILTSLRVAVGVSWLVVVAAEMLGVESGLGYLVLDARNQVRYDRVVAAMIVIGLIGLLIDLVMRRFELAELERRGMVTR